MEARWPEGGHDARSIARTNASQAFAGAVHPIGTYIDEQPLECTDGPGHLTGISPVDGIQVLLSACPTDAAVRSLGLWDWGEAFVTKGGIDCGPGTTSHEIFESSTGPWSDKRSWRHATSVSESKSKCPKQPSISPASAVSYTCQASDLWGSDFGLRLTTGCRASSGRGIRMSRSGDAPVTRPPRPPGSSACDGPMQATQVGFLSRLHSPASGQYGGDRLP